MRKRITRKAVGMLLTACIAALSSFLPPPAIARPHKEAERSEAIKEINDFRKERDDFFKNHVRSPLKGEDKLKFNHLSHYPVDIRYRFQGTIERYAINIRDPQHYVTFLTNRGTKKRYVRYGQFRFTLNGRLYTLQLYKSILSDTLFIPFRDKTNAKETYLGGRYLDAEIMLPEYETAIDFNLAYNPSCAYNENFICVIPPEENILSIDIQAGKKRFR